VLDVSVAELAARREAWTPPKRHFERGFGVMHQLHVTQANKGCDFDFLEEPASAPTQDGEPEIH
jgi:dihydroxy-acid dehydratase